MQIHRFAASIAFGALTVLAACKGGEQKAPAESTAATSTAAATPSVAGPIEPGPGGKVIEIEMITDDKGNYFKPNEIEAKKGDVLRYKLTAGVHNVHFLPDSNPGKTGLPPASDMLQLPGQTHDIAVSWDEGSYYFQCDPHAALGMHGRVKVEK